MIMEDRMKHLDTLIRRYPALAPVRADIEAGYRLLADAYRAGGKLLVAGNGGSCADADHIVGELMKGFVLPRPVPADLAERLRALDPERGDALARRLQGGLPAIALTQHPALTTAYMNDVDGGSALVFAQQAYVLGRAGDVFLGISTSGNSENVLEAALVARARGMKVLALVGQGGGKLAGVADVAIRVPATETYQIQEYHLPVYHALCLMLEEEFFS